MGEVSIHSFKQVTPDEILEMQKIFEESHFRQQENPISEGYIYDKTDYEKIINHDSNIGRVFFIKDKGDIIGFAFCLDSIDLKSTFDFPIEFIASSLTHEWPFIQDISKIGHFGFVNQLAIKKSHRRKNYSNLILKELFSFYEEKSKAIILATVVHQLQFKLLNILKKQDIIFVDSYIPYSNISNRNENFLWYRIVKILNQQQFYRKINPDTIPETFSTVIPIQLNLTASNINNLISQIDNARIIWSCFFQYKYSVLERIMKGKYYMGYYQPLINIGEENFESVTKSLKKIIHYLNKRDTKASIPSLSQGLTKKSGFEFILVDDDLGKNAFPSFPNPVIFNVKKLSYNQLEKLNVEINSEKDIKNWNYWIELHKEMYNADKLTMRKSERWCHAVIPISFSGGGVIGMMFTFLFKPDSKNDRRINDLAYTISDAFAKNMFNIILKIQQKEMVANFMKFAISTVMSRNLSHNFGSHILAKLSSPSLISKIIEKKRLKPSEQIADFNSYLRTRMDFIADVSTSEPVNSISRNLNMQVLERFRNTLLVKKYISGTSLERVSIEYVNKISKVPSKDDVVVQIPNGTLGEHALFIIIENIIRNSIKHEKPTTIRELKITVEVSKYSKNNRSRGYSLRIYDNILRITKDTRELVSKLNHEYINRSIIKEKHRIRSAGWGILEMKVAACYLRKKHPAKYVDIDVSPAILKAVKVSVHRTNFLDKSKGGSFLGFDIYLKKPREVLFLDSKGVVRPNNEQEWINRGIKIINPIKRRGNSFETQTHEIVISFDCLDREEVEEEKIYPLRWIYLNNYKEQGMIVNEFNVDIEKGILTTWKFWLRTFLKRKEVTTTIDLTFYIDNKKVTNYVFLSDSDTIYKNKVKIIYDHHGNNSPSIDLSSTSYYEAFNSNSPTGILLLNINSLNTYKKERLFLELIESALTNILIIDERIQQGLYESSARLNSKDIPISFEELEQLNIHVPTHNDFNMFSESFGVKEKPAFVKWVQEKELQNAADFIVIHQGIIERMVGTSRELIQSFISELKSIINSHAEIVITSGRGKPHELPKNILFLNYSNIALNILEQRSKYHLCQILFSARARFNHDEL